VTPKCVRAVDEKGKTIEIPATDIVLAAGPWTTGLASRLLGKRAGEALDIEPRFEAPFPAPRPLLTTIFMPQIAGAQPLSFFDPQSPSPRMLSSPNSPCLRANRSLLNSTLARMARCICTEITQTHENTQNHTKLNGINALESRSRVQDLVRPTIRPSQSLTCACSAREFVD
jgi:hypothetical protein